MGELGLLANLTAVIGAGLHLSIALYGFASTVGSAGREIEDMGCDMSLLCRVLKQVQTSLSDPRSARLSMTAIQDIQDIALRCETIQEDIRNILTRLKRENQASVNVMGRLKWPFNRPKVLMLRASLQSCTAYLHLMLYTVDCASRAAIPGSRGMQPDSHERDEDADMTHSLMLAQQCANRRLEEIEDQAETEDAPGEAFNLGAESWLGRPAPSSTENLNPSQERNQPIRVVDVSSDQPLRRANSLCDKRTSVLITEHIFGGISHSGMSARTPIQRIDLRQSIARSDALLQRWTGPQDTTAWTDPEQTHQPLQNLSQIEPDRASYVSWDSEPRASNVLEAKLLKAEAILREKEREHQILKEESKRAWEELGRREAAGQANAISLRSGLPTFVSGIEVVPTRGAEAPVTENVDRTTGLLSQGENTRREGSDQRPDDNSIWVWDNTREEILRVQEQVRGELPAVHNATSITEPPESFQRQADWPPKQAKDGSRIQTPKARTAVSTRSRIEVFPARPSNSARAGSVSKPTVVELKKLDPQSRPPERSKFPHAFERWEILSSHWEGLTSYWVRRLQENSNDINEKPYIQQMARQITDLSAAGANLFHAVVELQRLRASSERKFQRWFFETKQEHERALEVQRELEGLLQAEWDKRVNCHSCLAKAEQD